MESQVESTSPIQMENQNHTKKHKGNLHNNEFSSPEAEDGNVPGSKQSHQSNIISQPGGKMEARLSETSESQED